jgi:orotidine-5'-phosphate decarboxylase
VSNSRIIVALDYANPDLAYAKVRCLDPEYCRLKVGKELFTGSGPAFIRKIMHDGYQVFLDLKFHDIPNTVAKACTVAAELGVWMLNVHASGGREMLMSARDAIDKCAHQPLLIGVTVLTSMADGDLQEIGILGSVDDQVLRLAGLCSETGLDGIVCSAREVTTIRNEFGKDFCIVTPGIRPVGSSAGDQKRIMTPSQAILAGADYLVIGRPVTQAKDPMQALIEIAQEIKGVNRDPVLDNNTLPSKTPAGSGR